MIPNHIAIIPDGNRRWAKAHRLLPWKGHEAGAELFWDIADACLKYGIKYMTFWGASYDNIKKRSKIEVKFLFQILATELSKPELHKRLADTQTRVRVIGEWRDLVKDKKLLSALENIEKETAHNSKNFLTILFGYDGQREMASAVERLRSSKEKISPAKIREHLWTHMLPDVDYVIRTGGEPHWSAGFMMWLTANSQFYFTDTLWPAFTPAKLKLALAEFAKRGRRLGA